MAVRVEAQALPCEGAEQLRAWLAGPVSHSDLDAGRCARQPSAQKRTGSP